MVSVMNHTFPDFIMQSHAALLTPSPILTTDFNFQCDLQLLIHL